MTATTINPATLVAGAKDQHHGRHEDPCEGWDCWTRTTHGYDPDADARGRHAATSDETTEGKR